MYKQVRAVGELIVATGWGRPTNRPGHYRGRAYTTIEWAYDQVGYYRGRGYSRLE